MTNQQYPGSQFPLIVRSFEQKPEKWRSHERQINDFFASGSFISLIISFSLPPAIEQGNTVYFLQMNPSLFYFYLSLPVSLYLFFLFLIL